MELLRSLVDRVFGPGRAAVPTTIVVRHEPSARYLAPGFTLEDDPAAALQFDGLRAAVAFLERHASLPGYAPLEVELALLESSAA